VPRKSTLSTVAVLVCLLACSKEPPPDGGRQPAHQERKSVSCEEVVVVEAEPAEGFDPLLGWGSYGNPLIQSTLLQRDADMRLVGDLAESWSLSEDRLTWHIRIRPGARFSDGTPVTARDVAFTFNRAALAGGKTDVTVLEKAVPTGPYEVELRLKKPQITFVNRLVTLGIVSEQAYGETYGRNPIGSGPYRLVQWDEGRQAILEANPLYYGPRPGIRRVVLLYLKEDTAFAAAKASSVHVTRVPQILARQKIPGMAVRSIPSVDNRGICFPVLPAGAVQLAEGYPVGNDVTSHLSIRRAINYAIDRKALVDGVLEGYGSAAYGPVSRLPWDEPQGAIPDGDPEEARKILAEDGWQDLDGDGIVEKGGLEARITLLYPADDAVRQALALAVADQVRRIGIEMVVTARSWDDLYRLMYAHPVLFGFGSLDQTEMHNLYYGKRQGDRVHNPGFYRNEKVDRYLEQAMTAKTEEDAIAFWRKAQWDGETGYSARGDAAWAWLVNVDHVYFVDDRLDLGRPRIEQHGSSITANLPEWRWKEGTCSATSP
jgi:peptide/nickel transport system substrate-binding protein